MFNLDSLAGIGHENRIGVVDMCIDFSGSRRLAQEVEAAVTNRDMIHFSRTDRPPTGQIGVHHQSKRAVEQNDPGIMYGVPQPACDLTDT